MTTNHDNSRKRVREPVQVYLDVGQRRRLDRLSDELGLTKSDVVRRALEVLESQIADPRDHPALRIIGIAAGVKPTSTGYDIAREHDRFLAESEIKSWKPGTRRKRGN
jgi:hypothetical protein